MKTKKQKDMQKSIKAKKRAELRVKARKTWNEVKDMILLLILLNILIGLLQQIDISSLTASKTIIIERETIIRPAEASETKEDVKEQEEAKMGEFSAYNAEPEQTDGDPFTMASGKRVYEGAVANNCLPFGTKIEVNGKVKIVEDRMNSRYGCEHFDIFMTDYDDAIKFGRQKLEYKVIL